MTIFEKLVAPFPTDSVGWRAQTLSKDGTKAMALAYIDARDVMRRLDETVGAGNWQDKYEVATGGRVLCTLSIRLNNEWISKSDGAGDTKVEADKGAISEAFKRAAVKWGIGRYLYDMPTPWVPCESYQASNGKRQFSRFTDDPWKHIKPNSTQAVTQPKEQHRPANTAKPKQVDDFLTGPPSYVLNGPPAEDYLGV